MLIEKLNSNLDIQATLKELGVDGGGIQILSNKAKIHIVSIKNLHVGAANILKQDALSIGADLAVPRGTVVARTPEVDCLLIATTAQLKLLSKKELVQPFGLRELAHKLAAFISVKMPKQVEVMGVINANDDSFYSASRFSYSNVVDKIEQMIEDGVSIIDIGAVSSAPNSSIVSAEEELQRLKPVLESIKAHKLYERVKFSIDSYEPLVIKEALESGFSIVNDITGLQNDAVSKLCAEFGATAVIMHMQGSPQTMQDNPQYENILSEVYEFFDARVSHAQSLGVKDFILDVGIGFGKTLEHNLSLIKNLEHFMTLGHPLLVGASRKSLIDKISPSRVDKRLAGTLALHLEAIRNGATYLRVHDVYEHTQAIKVQQRL